MTSINLVHQEQVQVAKLLKYGATGASIPSGEGVMGAPPGALASTTAAPISLAIPQPPQLNQVNPSIPAIPPSSFGHNGEYDHQEPRR
jgi:hypothetical protein